MLSDLGIEYRLLLACALAPPEIDLTTAFARAPELSWKRLLEIAATNKLRPQLAAHAPVLQIALSANRGRGLFMAGELVRVLDSLRTQNIVAVPYKGPVFTTLLGDELGSREMADLDVLVRPADVVRAATALAPLGYTISVPPHALASPWLMRVTSELPIYGPSDSTLLELHWEASPHWYPAPCTVEDVMGHLTEKTFFGCPIHWPAPEELFLLHVADGLKSCGRGIRWIADVVKILRRHTDLDWDRIRNVAARNGGLNSIRAALASIDGITGDIARDLDIPALAVTLPAPARTLADEARRVAHLARTVQSIRVGLQFDNETASAIAHFRWALALADRPMRTAGAIIRYLSGPTITDVAAMPPQGESDAELRLRAFRRRLRGLLR